MGIIEVSKKTQQKKVVFSYFMIAIAAMIFTVGSQGFLQIAQTFPAGMGAIAQIPTFIWHEQLLHYVTFIYFGINIPMILFFWKRNNRRFMLRTIFSLLVQTALGSLFLIPAVQDLFSNLLNLPLKGENIEDYINNHQWTILVLSTLGSLFMALGIALSWKFGGSTGGTDFIGNYYSTKKHKPVGNVLSIVAIFIVGISFSITITQNEGIRSRWVMTLFGTFIYIIAVSLMVNTIYPKYKKVEMTIISDKYKKINDGFRKKGYWHSWSTHKFESGFTEKKKCAIKSNIFLMEESLIVPYVLQIDPNAYITFKPIRKIRGNMSEKILDQF